MIETRRPDDPRDRKLREMVEAQLAKVEGQAFFTAVMTDTYIEEEDDEQDSHEG